MALNLIGHQLLQRPEVFIVNAKRLELGNSLVEILRARTPVAAGPGQNAGRLLKRQAASIEIEVGRMGIKD